MSVATAQEYPATQTAQPSPLPPLFRWPGGKRWLVGRLRRLVPSDYCRYVEPFFGGGALFFAVRPSHAIISDANEELMATYRAIRDDPEAVGECLRAWPSTPDTYYQLRAARPTDASERAARTVFLTSHAFNGIYRVNLKGEFNVPWGGRSYEDLGSIASLTRYSAALQGVTIRSGDFQSVLAEARCGDLVYLDPPYTVAHSNNGFLKYNDKIFSWDDQGRLAAEAKRLAALGCHVVVSNADHHTIHDLYGSFTAIPVSRHSVMAADARKRAAITEYVFTNIPGVDLG